MGIRIKKSIGYGFCDIQENDPRFREGFEEKIYDHSSTEFIEWLMSKDREELFDLIKPLYPEECLTNHRSLDYTITWYLNDLKEKEKIPYHNLVHYCSEYGSPQVILFQPVEEPTWSRHDDIIDYTEAEDSEPSVRLLDDKSGIYPFSGATFRKTFAENKGDHDSHLAPAHWAMLRGSWDPKKPPLAGEEIAEYIRTSYRPQIPHSIFLFAYWLDIFTDWQTSAQNLQPMIYTYWS